MRLKRSNSKNKYLKPQMLKAPAHKLGERIDGSQARREMCIAPVNRMGS
jgi:hypothetical protein